MKEASREFLARLDAEEQYVADEIKLDTIGLGMLTAIKEFDFYHYNLVRGDGSGDPVHHFYLMQLGLPKLVAAVLSSVPEFRHPVVTFRSDRALILGALDMTAAFGLIEQGRRFAHAAFAGECAITRVNDRLFDIVLPDVVFNMEHHEASIVSHYDRISRERLDAAIRDTFEKTGISGRLDILLKDNVYVFGDHFIGYDAHPDLDDFFFGIANAEIAQQSGYDTFAWNLRFGEVTMQKYILALTYFLSLAIKHERFAAALMEKSPQLRLRDILTITSDKEGFEANLIDALNRWGPSFEGYTPLSREEAKEIIRVLSVRRDNLPILASTMAPLPFLIEFSESAWVRSNAAAWINGVEFLLNSLRYNFPKDYDRNQQNREKSMQRALRRIMTEDMPDLTYIDNVTLRRHGRSVTDIDFAAIDEADGTIILFQLKHQDHYGGDMRRRTNRATRLREQVGSWLQSVRTWLAEEPAGAILSALRLKADFPLRRVRLVVISRHFAHFLSSVDLAEDAAYSTWMQFFDALVRIRAEKRPPTLTELFEVLTHFMSHKVAKGDQLDLLDSYHLGSVSYRVRPVTADKSDEAPAPPNRR